MQPEDPGSWAQLAFGLPTYVPPPAHVRAVTTVRHKLDGASVIDASVGGHTVCGDGVDFWTRWGDTNEDFYTPDHSQFNIQNQADVADWPCFSKYYVTFPLDSIPASQTILSATLTLHQFGNAGGPPWGEPTWSLIQVLTVAGDWDAASLTWNNAPLAVENVSRAWVDPISGSCNEPCIPRTWDVAYAVARAYADGQPLRLVLYSADDGYHSGKYFYSSDTADWNAQARPTLQVTWGSP
jgi:hypothetical protein